MKPATLGMGRRFPPTAAGPLEGGHRVAVWNRSKGRADADAPPAGRVSPSVMGAIRLGRPGGSERPGQQPTGPAIRVPGSTRLVALAVRPVTWVLVGPRFAQPATGDPRLPRLVTDAGNRCRQDVA